MAQKRRELVYLLLWAGFANGLFASLISAYALFDRVLPQSPSGWIYLVLQQIGHFQFLSWLVFLPLALVAIIIPYRRLLQVLAVLLFSVFLIATYADYAVYQLYRFHFNSMVWNMLFGGAAEQIFVFDIGNILTFSGIVGGILLVEIVIISLIQRYRRIGMLGYGWWVFVGVLLVQISGQGLYAWSDAWSNKEVMSQIRHVPMPIALTMKRFLARNGWLPKAAPEVAVFSRSGGEFQYPLKPMQCEGNKDQMNLLVMVSDGLRFDMLNPQVTPFWSEFSKQSQVFTRHQSTGNATRFGVFGLFSGLYGSYWFDALNNRNSPVLISELKKNRYRFGLFASAKLSSPEFDRAIFSEISESVPDDTAGSSVIGRDLEITRNVRQFIQHKDEAPFFGFVFFDAPHAYVYPPEDERFKPALESINYLKLNNKSDPTPFKNRYQNSIYFNDRLSAEIIQTLKDSGKLDNTIVILTGDHGQEMNETRTNSWGHNSNFSRYQVQVPMIVFWPGKPAKVYDHLTSHVDIVPTLMQELLRCNNPPSDYSNGRSLFDEASRDFVMVKNWNNHAIVTADVTHVFSPYGTESYQGVDYRPIKESVSLDSSMQFKVLESISRFYRK